MKRINKLNSSYNYVCEHSKSVWIKYNKIDEMIEQIINLK